METKAQKAALASIKAKLTSSGDSISDTYYSFKETIKDVEELKTKYCMDNKVFNNAVEEIYNILMERKHYDDAAAFAKKYGL